MISSIFLFNRQLQLSYTQHLLYQLLFARQKDRVQNKIFGREKVSDRLLICHSEISDKLPEASSLLERVEGGTFERGIETEELLFNFRLKSDKSAP